MVSENDRFCESRCEKFRRLVFNSTPSIDGPECHLSVVAIGWGVRSIHALIERFEIAWDLDPEPPLRGRDGFRSARGAMPALIHDRPNRLCKICLATFHDYRLTLQAARAAMPRFDSSIGCVSRVGCNGLLDSAVIHAPSALQSSRRHLRCAKSSRKPAGLATNRDAEDSRRAHSKAGRSSETGSPSDVSNCPPIPRRQPTNRSYNSGCQRRRSNRHLTSERDGSPDTSMQSPSTEPHCSISSDHERSGDRTAPNLAR